MNADTRPATGPHAAVDESAPAPPEIVSKLQWLMFFRMVMFTVLLGSTLAFEYASPVQFPHLYPEWAMLGLIVATYVLTIIYAVVLKRLRAGHEIFAYVQLMIDLITSVVLVTLTGGTESLFLFTFSLTVLAASILLYRRGAMYVSAVATGLVVLIVTREAMGWWLPSGPAEGERLRSVFLSGMTNVTAVFLVALLAGYLSEQLRAAGQRLRFASADIEALRALNEHIITSIQSGLLSYTLDYHIIFINPAAARMTGLAGERVLYHDVSDLFPSLRERDHEHPERLRRWEEEYVRPDGLRRVLGFSLSPLLDAGGLHQGWILIFQDLTPIRQMEQKIKRSEQLAAIGKMAAGIAHEIRNPLASMSGSIQMMSQTGSLDPVSEKLMGIVLRETDRLNALVTDFLQFARPQPPQLEQIQLRAMLAEMVEVFAYLRYQEDVAAPTSVILDMDEEVELEADPRQLKQVLWNLLNNAAEAASGEVIIRVRADRAAKTVQVRVIDDGCGIPAEVQGRIYDPFFTTKDSGSGLGLAQVLRIVEDHGGSLHAESEPGVGSTFTVTLPLVARATTLTTELLMEAHP